MSDSKAAPKWEKRKQLQAENTSLKLRVKALRWDNEEQQLRIEEAKGILLEAASEMGQLQADLDMVLDFINDCKRFRLVKEIIRLNKASCLGKLLAQRAKP